MVNTIDMQNLQYLNLFGKVTKVDTRFCFMYNNVLVFCVPRHLVSKAVGKQGSNVKRMSELLRKKIKIIAVPEDVRNAREFIQHIVSPVEFKDLEIKDDEIILTAGMQSKAALLGRNKRRLIEMQKIVKSFFERDFKII
jgi:NusA-like KH domain protein